jgi:hypothetical protein
MLTVTENPSDYNFSKSPVICEIETDNMYTSPVSGVKAKAAYTFSVGVAVGAFIEIITTTTTLHLDFIAYTNPPTVGKLRQKDPGDSFTDYWDKIESDMLLNSYISSNYTITQDGLGAFTLDAINTGLQYSLHNCVYNGLGINFFNYFSGSDDIPAMIKPNYEIRVELFIETLKNSGVYESVLLVKKQPYSTQKVKFDLQKYVDACLDYYFPEPNLSLIKLCEESGKQFFIQIKEYFGTPATAQLVTINPSLIMEVDGYSTKKGDIIKAGFSPRWNKVQPKNQLSAYIWNYPLYLTTREYRKTIKKRQPEYLYFCLAADVPTNDLQLKFVKKYNDGTSDLIQYSAKYTGACNKGSVICFPVNPSGGVVDSTFTLANTAAYKIIVSIVSETDQATNISPDYEYILDYNPIGEDRIFLFTNSMSGVDTLRTTGNYEQIAEFARDVSSRIYWTTDKHHLGTNSESNTYKKETFTAFTGWLSADDLKWVDELFLAKYKVEVIDAITYAPITITSAKFKKHATNQNLYGLDIEYYHQLTSNVTDNLTASI